MRTALLIVAMMSGLAVPALAQSPQADARNAPEPVSVEEWSTDKVSAIGVEMYRLDSAAWLATDVLLAGVTEDELKSLRGWLIAPVGDDLNVSFYREGDAGPIPGWDVLVSGNAAGPLKPATASQLTETEQAQARALTTARANIGALRCSPQQNTVIIKDPDSENWLVWLLTPMPQSGAIPIGGHYRFRISADGATVLRRDQLSNTCFFSDRPPEDAEDTILFFTQIVSKGPVETQVFLSIQNQLTLVIAAGDRFFSVEGARIADITDMIEKP